MNFKVRKYSCCDQSNPKVFTLGKPQGTVIKCFKLLPADASWNNVKSILRQQFSLVLTVIHGTEQLVHKYQQKVESLQEFNFKFSELIQDVINCEPIHNRPIKNLHVCAEIIFFWQSA